MQQSRFPLKYRNAIMDCMLRHFLALLSLGVAVLPLPAQTVDKPASADNEPIPLPRVVVTPSRFGIEEERTLPGATLTATELEALPQVGEDLYRMISRLPGLASDDFSAQFWVRGAPNDQLRARFDGVDLLQPFHLKDFDGVLSIVDVQTISRIDLNTGGFTAEYGDRLAGVLEMETMSATSRRPKTTLGLSLTALRGTNQGSTDDGKINWLVAARRGYPDVALKLQGEDDKAKPRYYDIAAKAEWRPAAGHTLSLHALHAADTLRFHDDDAPVLNSDYQSDYVWTRWRGRIGTDLTGEAVLSATRHTWERKGEGFYYNGRNPLELFDDRQLETFNLRQDWSLSLTPQALLRGGIELETAAAEYTYHLRSEWPAAKNGVQTVDVERIDATLTPSGDRIGAYLAPRLQPFRTLTIEPSLRFDRHTYTGESEWSPRFNAAWTQGPWTLRGAWGLYRQAQGLHEVAIGDGETGFHPSERAEHRVLGLSRALGAGLHLRLEAYERKTNHVRPMWVNVDDYFDVFPEAQRDRLRYAPARARARGVEILLERRTAGPFGWTISYALAESKDLIDGKWRPRPRDQEHTVYSDITWAPTRNWLFSASWQLHTGWPYTPVGYALIPLNNNRRFLQTVYGAYNSARLPTYHRLDLRASRRFVMKHGTLRVFIDVFNAYNAKNQWGYHRNVTVQGADVNVELSRRKLFPVVPSGGLSWEF